ncbi:DHA2 family efflux MFS transporter permease subunit [Paenibacillus xylaniclasticus]|uniref:DHA2 family efflux MFS transporter permease subunit n=1 Tax=Paenibacillus xylaniclasticus TaxID=588083 RepID=UPI001FE99B2D|nr:MULTISPECIES: DHA2 family efflux MFS transporter permease subunit [Paenibacillus]
MKYTADDAAAVRSAASEQEGQKPGMIRVMVISLALFVILLDSTVVNIALSSIIERFGMSLDTAAWIMNGYTMTVAMLLVFMGRLADRVGKYRLYQIGLLVFLISSLLCALATGPELLIVFRVLQGIGGAMAIPASMGLVRTAAPEGKVGAAMGIWSAAGALAIASGPALGGALTELAGWRAVFYINVPVIGAALLFMLRLFKDYREERVKFRLNPISTILLSGCIYLLTDSLLSGQEQGWTSWRILSGFSCAVVLFLAYIVTERRSSTPLVDFRLFRNRAYMVGVSSNFLGGMLLMGIMILAPLYFTEVRHYSTIHASLAITPLSAILLVAAPLVGKWAERAGAVRPLTAGYAIALIGCGMMAAIQSDSSMLYIIASLTIVGTGVGFIAVTSLMLSTLNVHPADISMASGVFAMMRNLGGAVGVALFVSVMLSSFHGSAAAMENAVTAQVEQSDWQQQAKSEAIASVHAYYASSAAQTADEAVLAALSLGSLEEEQSSQLKAWLTAEAERAEASSMGRAYLGGMVLTVLFMTALLTLRGHRATQAASK